MRKKIILELNEEGDSIYAKGDLWIGSWADTYEHFGEVNEEEDNRKDEILTDPEPEIKFNSRLTRQDLIELKSAGFTASEIIDLHTKQLI